MSAACRLPAIDTARMELRTIQAQSFKPTGWPRLLESLPKQRGHPCEAAVRFNNPQFGFQWFRDFLLGRVPEELAGLRPLEPESQRNLQRSCAAGLKHGRQSAARAAGAEHEVQRRSGVAKQ